MNDPWTDLPTPRIRRPDRGMPGGWQGELLSLTLGMLTISFVSLVVCVACGLREHITLAALGIAIYISSKHFGHLSREIAALREQVALSGAEPVGFFLPPANEGARWEVRPEWQVDGLLPEREGRTAMTR